MSVDALPWDDAGGVLVLTSAVPGFSAAGADIKPGLVARVTAPGGALDGALVLATELALMSRPAPGAVIRSADAAFDLPLDEGSRFEATEVHGLFEHGGGREGIAAFLEKCAPEFGP